MEEKSTCLRKKITKDRIFFNFLHKFYPMEQELVSKIWQIFGLVGRVVPGLLLSVNGNITYITEEGIQFNVPVAEIKDVKWPFLRMGLGFDASVNGKKYKFSFTKPNPTAPELDDEAGEQLFRLTDAGRFWDAIGTLSNLKTDKATTKKWREILHTK